MYVYIGIYVNVSSNGKIIWFFYSEIDIYLLNKIKYFYC